MSFAPGGKSGTGGQGYTSSYMGSMESLNSTNSSTLSLGSTISTGKEITKPSVFFIHPVLWVRLFLKVGRSICIRKKGRGAFSVWGNSNLFCGWVPVACQPFCVDLTFQSTTSFFCLRFLFFWGYNAKKSDSKTTFPLMQYLEWHESQPTIIHDRKTGSGKEKKSFSRNHLRPCIYFLSFLLH